MGKDYVTLSKLRGMRAQHELSAQMQYAFDQAALLGFDAGFLPASWLTKSQRDFTADLQAVQRAVEARLVARSCQDSIDAPPNSATRDDMRKSQQAIDVFLRDAHVRRTIPQGQLEHIREASARLTREIKQFTSSRYAVHKLREHPKFALERLDRQSAEFVTRAPIVLHGLSQTNVGHWAVCIQRAGKPQLTLGPAFTYVNTGSVTAHPHVSDNDMCFGDSTGQFETLCGRAWKSPAQMLQLLDFVHEKLQLHTTGEYEEDLRTATSFNLPRLTNLDPEYAYRYGYELHKVLTAHEAHGKKSAKTRREKSHAK